jgi:hypothetical protein
MSDDVNLRAPEKGKRSVFALRCVALRCVQDCRVRVQLKKACQKIVLDAPVGFTLS